MNIIHPFIVLFLMPVQSMAEGTPDNSDTLQSGSDPLANLDLFQMITPLIMVIALIFALAWLVKKLNPNLPKIGKDIQVISTTPLSNHSKLCLIRAGGQDILIGVTNTNISHIQTFNEPVSPPVESEDPAEFSQQFKKLLKR